MIASRNPLAGEMELGLLEFIHVVWLTDEELMARGNYELVIDEIRAALAACTGLYFFCPSTREQVTTVIDFISDLPTEPGAIIVVVHKRQVANPGNESPGDCKPPT